jgi:arylsulfatase A-like enzyme
LEIINAAPVDRPFLLYLAYAMPHLPLHVSEAFRGKSRSGLYGDVLEELDWSVGQILDALERRGLSENTLVFFASDNGPWSNMPPRMLQAGNERWHAGSSGPLRGAKGQTYEGGCRVPAMFRWPGRISPGGVSPELVGMPDVYRTLVAVAGANLPEHVVDGHDLTPFLTGQEPHSPRKEYTYFLGGRLEAIRSQDWKLRTASGEPELFDMVTDPFERINRADSEPEKVKELLGRMRAVAGEVGVAVGN